MKFCLINQFIEAISQYNANLIKYETICDVVDYNAFREEEEYRLHLEEMRSKALSDYMVMLGDETIEKVIFHNNLFNRYGQEMGCYYLYSGYFCNTKLAIRDQNRKLHQIKDLKKPARMRIARFLSIQMEEMCSFFDVLEPPLGYQKVNAFDQYPSLVPVEMSTTQVLADDRIESNKNEEAEEKEEWLDVQDVCLMLHISRRTFFRLVSAGIIKTSTIGGKSYCLKLDILKVLKEGLSK